MKHSFFPSLALATVTVFIGASSAQAQLRVGRVVVVHDHSVTTPGGTSSSTTVLDSTTTNGLFNTETAAGTSDGLPSGFYPVNGTGVTGVIGNVSSTGGTVRVEAYGSNLNYDAGNYVFDSPRGSMDLHLASGSMLPSLSVAESSVSAYPSFDFKLTDVATNKVWDLSYDYFTPLNGTVASTNTLDVPVGAGDYLLSWSSSVRYQNGTSGSGYATLNLAVVPEPVTLAMSVLPAIALRRRRAR